MEVMTKKVLIDLEDVYVLKGHLDLRRAVEHFSKNGATSFNLTEIELFMDGYNYFVKVLFGWMYDQPDASHLQDGGLELAGSWSIVESKNEKSTD